MVIGVDITTNGLKIAAKLEKLASRQIYVAMSKAEQRTVETAQAKAKVSMKKDLHNPAKQTVNSIRREFRQAAKIKAGIGDSRVFVAPYLVEQLWPNTITTYGNRRKLERRVPKQGKSGIINPTKRIKNPAGNIRGLRNNKLKTLRDSKKYFEVSIGSKVKAKSGGYLKPGIYEIRQLKRSRRIRLIVEYQTDRYITPKWKFREVVRACYDKEYPKEFKKALSEEIAKLF